MPNDPLSPPMLPLPPMSAAILLRALFKRPAGHTPAGVGAIRHQLCCIDEQQVSRYRRALGFAGTHLPLTYCYLLAQRAHLATMLGAAFPFRLVGAIHVDNRLEAGIAPMPGRALELTTTVSVDPSSASGAVHAHLDTRAAQDGRMVFACRSSYLVVRGRRSHAHPARPARPDVPAAPDAPALTPVAAWDLQASSGREYAALSGDWNPIHLWPWSARLMGLKAPIIHGMHTLGRVCAELERAGGRPVRLLDGRFRAPIELGGTARLALSLGEQRYAVESGGRIAVEGLFDFDPSQTMLET